MSDIVITLPAKLWQKIVSGEKGVEVRKCLPKHIVPENSRVFVIEKGTTRVVGWFRYMGFAKSWYPDIMWEKYGDSIGVTRDWFMKYVEGKLPFYLWKIGEVHCYKYDYIDLRLLGVRKNPQCFAYVNI